MSKNEIRADYDAQNITVYQAYSTQIALPALKAKRFVAPFSTGRMTWIKPSFLWLMERSNWAQKAGQEHILVVTISRAGWDEAVSMGVLTSYEPRVHNSMNQWRDNFEAARVHVQWDPERSIRGARLENRSIQVGLSRFVIEKFVNEWIIDIRDMTPMVRKIHGLVQSGNVDKAKKLLPSERVYTVDDSIAKRLNMQD